MNFYKCIIATEHSLNSGHYTIVDNRDSNLKKNEINHLQIYLLQIQIVCTQPSQDYIPIFHLSICGSNRTHKIFQAFFAVFHLSCIPTYLWRSRSDCHTVIDFDVYVYIFHVTKLLFRITELSEDVEVLLVQTTFITESSYP